MYIYKTGSVLILLLFVLINSALTEAQNGRLNATKLLDDNQYPYEVHPITTEDGYGILLYRLHGRNGTNANGRVVFLNHGFISNAMEWTLRGPGVALAYILADSGYDVWMINNRGNDPTPKELASKKNYWDFSLDDIGRNDTSAAIDYVLNATNQSDLSFICHSQGCTLYYILCLEKPAYQSKINLFIALAPLISMKYVSDIYELGTYLKTIFPNSFDVGSLLFGMAHKYCNLGTYLCKQGYLLIQGGSANETSDSFLELMIQVFPASASSKNLQQMDQWIDRDDFCKFDYGTDGNQEKYGVSVPPVYNITLVDKTPQYIFYGGNDRTIIPNAIEYGLQKLVNLKKAIKVDEYGHNDFVRGTSVKTVVNDVIVCILNDHLRNIACVLN